MAFVMGSAGVGAILSSLFLSTTNRASSSLIQSPLQLSSNSAYLIALKGMGPAPLVQVPPST